MSSKYFDKNNKIYKNGLEAEKAALNFLINYKMEFVEEQNNNNNKYDIKTSSGTYEIKRDNKFKKYNSIFLEFQTIYNDNTLKFSGINTTTSDYYLFFCPLDDENKKYKIFEVTTRKLRDYINNEVLNNNLVVRYANCIGWKNDIVGKNYGYILDEEILSKIGNVYDAV